MATHRMPFGADVQPDGAVRFRLWAPDVDRERGVEVVLDDLDRRERMEDAGDGWYELTTTMARTGMAYRFALPDGQLVPDPASRFQPQGPNGPSRVIDAGRYRWQEEGWRGRPWNEAVVYELHVGTFTPEGTYRAAIARLPHLKDLGITVVELMPLAAFGGERGWGYDGVLLYSPHAAYGEPDDLRAFVDAAHAHGLMVMLDVVYNHFGPEGNYLNAYAAQFFAKDKPTPWGPAIDWREPPVRRFAIDNVLYWLEEFRFDGFRFDAVHALIDDSPTHILDEIAAAIRNGPGRGRAVHLVLENDANEAKRLVRGAGDAPRTYNGQWNDDWHHCAHVLLTGEADGYYAPYADKPAAMLATSLAEGFVWQGQYSPNHEEARGEPSGELSPLAFVNCLQNHDQIGNRALGERLTAIADPVALEVATALLLLEPQVPMLYMGEEWGTERPFLFFTGYTGDLADAVREGRRKEMARFPAFADPAKREQIPDPNAQGTRDASVLDWEAVDEPRHAARLALVRELIALRRTHLVPRLAGITGQAGKAETLGDHAVKASWRLADGARLEIAVNLGREPVAGLGKPAADPFFVWPRAAAGAVADGTLPGPAIVASLSRPGGGGGGGGGGGDRPDPEPVATYRLQVRADIDFAKATAVTPYLARLGISHLYASPLTRARAGSTHGYDVVDYGELDPALGGEAGFEAMTDAVARDGMGLLLDIVPNHMGVGPDNPWWVDLLAKGQDSPHARAFDVDWSGGPAATPVGGPAAGKLTLPVLGSPYGEILAKGELKLVLDPESRAPKLAYYDNHLPLSEASHALIDSDLPELLGQEPLPVGRVEMLLALASEPERLHRVIEAQHYRLLHWRAGSWLINYRRFFDVSDLAGVRQEDPAVFARAHALLARLVEAGRLQGVRIDHIDGLADPKAYLDQLQALLRQASGRNGPFWVLIEKILGEGEDLPRSWATAGTTGYEVLNLLGGLFLAPDGLVALEALYRSRTGTGPFAPIAVEAKGLALHRMFSAEVDRLAREAQAVLAPDLAGRDLPLGLLREALLALLAGFNVYRTYVDAQGAGPEDERRLDEALAAAKASARMEDETVFDVLARLLRGERPSEHGGFEGEQEGMPAARLAFVRRFQQTSGPLMAKSLEDTAFYRWHRLIAANEVGGEPAHPAVDPAKFHRICVERQARWPRSLVATATHDTKRGEDARLRLAVLSELPDLWDEATARWRLRDAELGLHPDDLWLLWQTIVAAWPLDLDPDDGDGLGRLADRLVAYMQKALREGKQRTTWTAPDAAYEGKVEHYIRDRLDPAHGADFLGEVAGVVARLAPAGAVNGLAQTLLKLTMPGVPDLYQGTELWEFSLVDPDNRRPVDFDLRARLLDDPRPLPDRLDGWRDGGVKLGLIETALAIRRARPALFLQGDYRPLDLVGSEAGHALAFARDLPPTAAGPEGGRQAVATVTLVPLRVAGFLGGSDEPLPPPSLWGDTTLHLPGELAHHEWRCAITGASYTPRRHFLLSELLATFPVALLVAS